MLEIDDPNAVGSVVTIDGDQKITIKTTANPVPIEVAADEKTHTLKVSKGGFETFTKQFTVKSGEKETIRVRLETVAKTGRDGKPTPPEISGKKPQMPLAATKIPDFNPEPVPRPGTWEPHGTIDMQKRFPGNHIAAADTLPGLLLAPAALNGVKRWNVETRWPRHRSLTCEFSPDGKLVATASSLGAIRIYDAETLELQRTLPNLTPTDSIWWHPDGNRLTAGNLWGGFKCWSTDGTLVFETAGHASYSPDGAVLAGIPLHSPDITFHDVNTGEVMQTIENKAFEGTASSSPVWSPDGQLFAVPYFSSIVGIWSREGKLVATVENLNPQHRRLRWSPDGRWIGVREYEKAEIQLVGRDGERGRTIKLSDKGSHQTLLLVPRWTTHLREWSIYGFDHYQRRNGRNSHRPPGPKNGVIAVSPDGKRVVSFAKTLQVFDAELKLLREIPQALGGRSRVAWRPQGDGILTDDENFGLDYWSATGRHQQRLRSGGSSNHRIAWHPSGEMYASTADGRGLWIEELAGKRSQYSEKSYRILSWSANGKYLFCGSLNDRVFEIFDATGSSVHSFQSHGNMAGGFAPDKDLLVFVDDGKLVTCSDTDKWELTYAEGFEDCGGQVEWSPDGRFLFVG